jgi:hypothetical protein
MEYVIKIAPTVHNFFGIILFHEKTILRHEQQCVQILWLYVESINSYLQGHLLVSLQKPNFDFNS